MTTFEFIRDLTPPSIIEPVSYQTIVDQITASTRNRMPAWVPDPSDPVSSVIEEFAYREFTLRQLVNAQSRQLLLAFAVGSNLDHIGVRDGIQRSAGESDDDYRVRIARHPTSLAVGTTSSIFEFTRDASILVTDVGIFVQPDGQTVDVYIQSSETPGAGQVAGTPSSALIAAVRTYINQDDRKHLDDTYRVWSPAFTPYTITASYTYTPELVSQTAVASATMANVLEYVAAQRKLLTGVSRAGIISAIHRADGVFGVNLTQPSNNISPSPDSVYYATPAGITLIGTAI